MRFVVLLVSLVAIGLALGIAVSGPGTRLGLWEYGTGLKLIRMLALPVMIAAGASAAAFLVALFTARKAALIALIAAVTAGGAAMAPIKMKEAFEVNPFIHDITTDFSDPPAIVAAANEDRKNPPHYVGDEPAPRSDLTTAEAQRAAFPDIKTLHTEKSVDDAAAIAASVIREMGMKLLSNGPAGDDWVIEAAYTSMWFGFVDDFVVRIRAEGDGAIVDIRSKSRVGGSDLGANAKRVRAFLSKFEKAAA